MKLAIIGATGLVGRQILQCVEEQSFPFDELLLVSSDRSIGSPLTCCKKTYPTISIEQALAEQPTIAIFSAGSKVSLEWAPRFAEKGTIVIDNSSAWRLDPDCPLVVPEVNKHVLSASHSIIANPNCSTIQLVMVLAPLHRAYRIRRVVVSTYQAVSGSGKLAIDQLMNERNGNDYQKVYPHPIDLNALPHIDRFLDNGYTKEEMKVVHETRKILEDDTLRITTTAVRIPTLGGHGESVNIEFENDFVLKDLKKLLEDTSGVVVQDDPSKAYYPMPITAQGKDDVFVGRIRRDESQAATLNLWIVSDPLRKGAATNSLQIAQCLLQ